MNEFMNINEGFTLYKSLVSGIQYTDKCEWFICIIYSATHWYSNIPGSDWSIPDKIKLSGQIKHCNSNKKILLQPDTKYFKLYSSGSPKIS